jgi:hypothetical protein
MRIPGKVYLIGARRYQQSLMRPPIVITKEHQQPPIATLRHIVRHLWDYDPGESGHLFTIRTRFAQVNLVYCPQNFAVPRISTVCNREV